VQPSSTTKIIETRIMIRKSEGWIFADYVWNDEQTEAYLDLNGSTKNITFKDENDVTINPMNSWKPTEYPASYLWHVKKNLYNEDYARWNCRFDDDGFLTVQYNKGTPESMIGWAVFEKEY
jgi:hypothetical protein